jgi:outer membrane murein-binding lipoprotein Lpp
MSSLETEVHGIKSSLATLSSDIRSLAEGNKTSWGTIAAWAAVVITVVGGFSSTLFIINQITVERTDDKLSANVENMNQQIGSLALAMNQHASDGHPYSVIAKIDSEFARVNATMRGLEREMVLRDNRDHEATVMRDMISIYRARFGDIQDMQVVHPKHIELPEGK